MHRPRRRTNCRKGLALEATFARAVGRTFRRRLLAAIDHRDVKGERSMNGISSRQTWTLAASMIGTVIQISRFARVSQRISTLLRGFAEYAAYGAITHCRRQRPVAQPAQPSVRPNAWVACRQSIHLRMLIDCRWDAYMAVEPTAGPPSAVISDWLGPFPTPPELVLAQPSAQAVGLPTQTWLPLHLKTGGATSFASQYSLSQLTPRPSPNSPRADFLGRT